MEGRMLNAGKVLVVKGKLFEISLWAVSAVCLLSSCSISEEARRIESVRQAQLRRQAQMSDDLTGAQVFVRSCNTCHPGGLSGLGPGLEHLSEHFPDDRSLVEFIRTGSGEMPAQTEAVLNDREMENLIIYLRSRW